MLRDCRQRLLLPVSSAPAVATVAVRRRRNRRGRGGFVGKRRGGRWRRLVRERRCRGVVLGVLLRVKLLLRVQMLGASAIVHGGGSRLAEGGVMMVMALVIMPVGDAWVVNWVLLPSLRVV